MPQPRRGAFGLDWKSLAVLFAYVLMLGFAILHYKPWEDEGRAWLDVREASLIRLTFGILRYEGHPALWYWILWPLPRLHIPFIAINWIAGLCGAASVYVLLRFAPFPFYLRALLPFTFALGYEYAVVGRSYVLFPLLGFWIAHLYRQKTTRPMQMAITLALFANLAVHATIIACCFALAWIRRRTLERRNARLPLRPTRPEWKAAAVFAASVVFVVIVIFPPRDLGPRANPQFMKLFRRVFPAAQAAPPRRPTLFRTVALASPGVLTPEKPGVEPGISVRQRLYLTFIYPIAGFAPLALLFEALVCVFLIRRRQSLLILAPLLLSAFLVVVYTKLWHTNLMWIALLTILWAAWDASESSRALTLQNGVAALLALLCLLQIPWTLHALRYETTHSTYPAEDTANFLKTLPRGLRIDGYDHSFTVMPYSRRQLMHRSVNAFTSVPEALADRPDVLLFRDTSISADDLRLLFAAGFHQTRSFCGTPFFPNQPLEPTCLVILQKN